jgi:hypothetical protein
VSAEPHHGCLNEFLALTEGLSVAAVARTLRCCSRSIRNYIAGRSPIPWHRIEVLRLLALGAAAASGDTRGAAPADEPAVVANIDLDPTAPDVPLAELLAWVPAPMNRTQFPDSIAVFRPSGRVRLTTTPYF